MTHDTGLVEAVKARILKAKADDVILEEHDANTLARAALDAINASGTHVVVPVEPTKEMIVAAEDKMDDFEDETFSSNVYGDRDYYTYKLIGWERAVYQAMLTAAKEQP